MQLKDAVEQLQYGVLGMWIAVVIRILLLSVAIAIYYSATRQQFSFAGIANFAGFLALIIGFFMGVISFRKKGAIYRAFRISRQSIIINFALTLIIVAISYLGKHAQGSLISSIMLGFFMYYPFSVIAYNIFSEKKAGIAAIIFILLLNPLTVIGAQQAANARYAAALGTGMAPCGVRITGFQPDSPARDAGMTVGEIITGIGDAPVATDADIKLIPGANVKTSDGQNYSMDPAASSLGITHIQVYCIQQ